MIAAQGTARHRWGDPICVFGDRTPTGCEQTERPCSYCSLIKITVHPPHGLPWREWSFGHGGKQFKCEGTPRCDASGEVAAL